MAALAVIMPSAGTPRPLAAASALYQVTSAMTHRTPAPSSASAAASRSLKGASELSFMAVTILAMSSEATTSGGTSTGRGTKR